MKRKDKFQLAVLLSFSILFTSCGTYMRAISGSTEKDMLKKVSLETGCSIADIKVIDKSKKATSTGNDVYVLDVCGKRMVYKHIGSVFMRDKEADKLMEEVQKGK